MYPQPIEIDELGAAFIAINMPEYNTEQRRFLKEFLSNHAVDLNKESMKKTFKDKIQVMDALAILNQFANHYEHEKGLIDEFKEEIEFLLITISDEEGINI